jgi:hypothetical protein
MKSVLFGAAHPVKDTKGPAAAVFAHPSSWRTRNAPLLCSAAMEFSNKIAGYATDPTGGATVGSRFFWRFNLYARRFFLNPKGTPPLPS